MYTEVLIMVYHVLFIELNAEISVTSDRMFNC